MPNRVKKIILGCILDHLSVVRYLMLLTFSSTNLPLINFPENPSNLPSVNASVEDLGPEIVYTFLVSVILMKIFLIAFFQRTDRS